MDEEDHKKKNKTKIIFTFSLLFCLGFLSNYLMFSRDDNFASTVENREATIEENLIKVTQVPEVQAKSPEKGWKENTLEITGDETQLSQIEYVLPEIKVQEVTKVQEAQEAQEVIAVHETPREYREIVEGSVWTTTSGFAEALSLDRQEFWKAWKNSYAVIQGKPVHFSQVGLFQAGTKIFWNPERGVFEIEGKGLGVSQEPQVILKSKPNKKAITFTTVRENTQKKEPYREVIAFTNSPGDTQKMPPIFQRKKEKILQKKPANTQRFINSLSDSERAVTGLVLDQTTTHLGQEYFRLFVSHWQRGQDDPFTISIIESSSPVTGIRILIKVNDQIVHQSFIRSRAKNIDELARQAVNNTRRFIDERRMGI